MTTNLSTATIPAAYIKIYDLCSTNGENISKDVYEKLLSSCDLDSLQIKTIISLVVSPETNINRTNFYKSLALAAWAQQGREISEKLFDSFTGDEYPIPNISNLKEIEKLKNRQKLNERSSPTFNLDDIVKIDTINVQLVPERKGFILKYSEYIVSSKRFNSQVTRRYNDFVALQELLLNRFPYRLVPSLPPKKMLISEDAHFLEERRRGLNRWLTLVCTHPVICKDGLINFFLTDKSSEIQHRIRDIFKRAPDEFMTSDLAGNASELFPNDHGNIAASREHIRNLVNIIARLKSLEESSVERQRNSGRDMQELAEQLRQINGISSNEMHKKCLVMSGELSSIGNRHLSNADVEKNAIEEKLALILDILVAHKELCERLEKGLAHDHQVALSKMLSLKKRKIQGVIRGTDSESVEQLEAKVMAQESVISNIELRTDFSLYCVHMETKLVYTYLETMPTILRNMVDINVNNHAELLKLWKNVHDKSGFSKSNGVH